MMLLEFDERVARFEGQPVNIPLVGVPRGYTPDVLVHYRTDPATGEIRKPFLTDIKHSDELRRNAEKYAPKFRVAERFAAENGWEFRVTTEKEIRIPRLANLKFLREYRNIEPHEQEINHLRSTLEQCTDQLSVADLLSYVAPSATERLRWLPVIWFAVLHRIINVDMDQPLTHSTLLRLHGSEQ
ncbi:TnsA endonuclease N-terminal domain-containing protein [Paraburkholderia denitrificans]|uniref:TnsA endonuclease N-terminal domain-containing protein n=1 Tax=Paraburkholderia denitrificans TaxID=694025 RepID=A0ABW0J8S5_9BURK